VKVRYASDSYFGIGVIRSKCGTRLNVTRALLCHSIKPEA
jgi:hypothetical protein